MIGTEDYYRKRFSEALDEHDVLNPYAYDEGTREFLVTEAKHNDLVERLLVEMGF